MHRPALSILLLFALIGLGGAIYLGVSLLGPGAIDAGTWLDRNRASAERIAKDVLAGAAPEGVDLPAGMGCVALRAWPGAVAFTLRRGGFKGVNEGVCYSVSDEAPPLGMGSEPPRRWEHLRGRWFAWAAE